MQCDFCEGMLITSEYICEGLYPLQASSDGIQLIDGNVLMLDNSGGEYARVGLEINYCPMCGRKLEGEQ